MRPLKLELEGFTAFKSRTQLDLGGLDLFAITGPTGAGKSSLIDAICFALYGRVPRVANEVGACISLGMDRMHVTLEFLAAGDQYRVFRETKRQGTPNVRLEKCVEGDWRPVAQGATGVTDRVKRVVGVDFDGFTRSVLLPQGQFQEFLAGSPDKRRDVLRALLRLEIYERVRARASTLASEQRAQLQSIQSQLDQFFAEATPENLARRKDELELANAESGALAQELIAWQEVLQQAQALNACLETLKKAETDLERSAGAAQAARALADEGDAALEQLQALARETEKTLASNEFDADLFAMLTGGANLALSLESNQRKLKEATTALKAREDTAAAAETAGAQAAQRLAVATAALDAAQHALIEAQRRDLAAALQSGLSQGDVCPVCGARIEALAPLEAAALDQAKQGHTEARRVQEAAQEAHTETAARKAAAGAALSAAGEAVEQWKRQVASDERKLQDALPDLPDRTSAVLQAALKEQRAARDEAQQLSKRLAEAQKALAQKQNELESARRDLAAKEHLLKSQQQAVEAAATAAARARRALEDAAARHALPQAAGALAAGQDPSKCAAEELRRISERSREVQQEIGRLEALVDRLQDDIEKAAELRRRLKKVQADLDIAADLAQMLQANKFQAFVQSEALRVLAENGSRRLQDLSGGRYRLRVNDNGQDFEAIDQWNADDRRSVKTLSGGETFLASLALALALAESLPGLAPDRNMTLDAIFLDEGFGSLDPEALDRAADALDYLRDGTRMVCVVTHLQDLAQRMPARVVVTKSEGGSSAAIV